MPDWDEDSPQLRENLRRVLERIREAAARRELPTVEMARQWQIAVMRNLTADDPAYVGAFRGETGLEDVEVSVGPNHGVESKDVSDALQSFQNQLQEKVGHLDSVLPIDVEMDVAGLEQVIELCAWAHAEWVRIHPFANGNGRTARLWANYLALRYGLPPFVRLRPRPNSNYGAAGERAMRGDWRPTVGVFRRLLQQFLEDQ